ncbi:MAG: M23 family metallopeptidase [Tannerellaceae bacterium]|jgi:murein DD-endopeptidase MepM/ murein hydrolase activator NlpD|nr:M23 family metallopeptidase [Tannerellaceae bacterium]
MGLFKSRKSYYLYDPNTLSYERVYPSFKDRIFAVVRHLSTGIVIAVAIYFSFTQFFDSPMEAQLRKENRLMQTQYEVLSLRLNDAFTVLNDVQQRDENLYRAIFQVESIPESIRKAGVGGVNRYEHLMSLSNPDLVVATTQKMDMLKRQLYVQSNSLEELVNIGKTQEERLKCIPAIMPVATKDLRRMASGYGMRIHPIYHIPKFHSGMDFSAPTGTDIYATGDGVITFSGWRQNYGNCITIDHGFGYQTLYGHMSKMNARVGQKVTRGEIIGLVGDTGLSTGPHLHYEVIIRGKHNDPSKFYFLDLSPEEYDQMIQLAANHGNVMD